ncbi:bifunctional diguanylate cyclase/phosphodiesterase [Vreelandella zhuhanensis]|nr:EAL domain-containing protein [Halomonas zhuhanensis]
MYVLALLMMTTMLGWVLSDQYQRDIQAGREKGAVRAELVAEWVSNVFMVNEYTLVGISHLLGAPGQSLFSLSNDIARRIETFLATRRDSVPILEELGLVDTHGRVILSSSSLHSAGYDISDLPFFKAFAQDSRRDQLVSPLVWSVQDQRHYIIHLHRLRGLEGHTEGFSVAWIDPVVFHDTLKGLGRAPGENITLLDNQMQLIAHHPESADSLNASTLGVSLHRSFTPAFIESKEQPTSLRMASPFDGKDKLYWLQQVNGLPFIVVVGEDLQGLLSNWLQRLWVLVSIALLLALLGGLVLRHYMGRLSLEETLSQRMAEREQARHRARTRAARLQALVSSIQDMVFVFDQAGRFTYVHAAAQERLALDPEAALGQHYRDVLPRSVADRFAEVSARVRHTETSEEFEYSLRIGRETRAFHSVVSPLKDAANAFSGVLAVVRDVTQAKANEAQLRIAATAFETHLGMMVTDVHGNILKVNSTFTRVTGYHQDEVMGRNPRMLSSGHHDKDFYRKLWQGVVKNGSWQGEIWNRRKNGEVFPEWLTISAVHNAKGALTNYVATLSDITERKAAEQEIHQLAFYDTLTGLANRRLLQERLSHVVQSSCPPKKSCAALLFIDLDNFKQVNDTLGPYAGDQLLQHIARELDQVLDDNDTLARLGGDEFAVLAHNLGSTLENGGALAERLALKLLAVLQRPISLGSESLTITGSIGITLVCGSNATKNEVLQQADMALFQAKEAGRNTLRFFDTEMQLRLQNRARLEADLRKALPNNELVLYYQAQVNAAGIPTGYEALLRWIHPVRGMVSPGEFIPLAEENRLIIEIGAWVLETACHQLVVWADNPATAKLTVAVNISPVQFHEPDFVERVMQILERTGASPQRLKLELTEGLLVEAQQQAREKMLRLKQTGLSFSLDDFGTGYSSLAYLTQLPLDQLKIDQYFVRHLLDDLANAVIVESTIGLAHSLGLEVIAEGVETEAQRVWLTEHHCHVFQGYLFARPLPVEAL